MLLATYEKAKADKLKAEENAADLEAGLKAKIDTFEAN